MNLECASVLEDIKWCAYNLSSPRKNTFYTQLLKIGGEKMILKKLLLILALLLIPSITLAGEWTGNLNILYG
ncbi:MAG TPA: hypothetical protein VMW42_07910 [Desulfatiglandales bacterium]|nr:hypothetical protein [Desulfatiglandales bacterium]